MRKSYKCKKMRNSFEGMVKGGIVTSASDSEE
jgi:hypothetical protein